MSRVKIVLVGGGSGGHFYPLMAIAESLRASEAQPDLYYAGPERYDEHTLADIGIEFVYIPAGKRRKYFSLLNYLDVFKTFFGALIALCKLYFIYPDVIVSKGGHTSVPIILAAWFLRIPIVIHESDARMGSANALALRAAHDVVIAYDELAATLTHPRVHVLGTPVRKALLAPASPNAHELFGADSALPILLVIGGSQGAERINNLVLDSLDELLPRYTVIHQTGEAHHTTCVHTAAQLIPDEALRARYLAFPFLSATQMNDAYHLASLVLSRAGSNSLYEIALHGKPSIIVPIPEEVSHDQRTNAYTYARTGAAVVIEEKNLGDGLLQSEIDRIMQDTALYERMSVAASAFGKTDVADRISAIIIDIAQQH